jgi:hypothetical protein
MVIIIMKTILLPPKGVNSIIVQTFKRFQLRWGIKNQTVDKGAISQISSLYMELNIFKTWSRMTLI